MADSARPNGKLTTGGVGGILLCAAFALFLVSGGLGMGGMQAAGGLGLIGMILLIGGGICSAMGFFGLGKIYGGTNGIGGLFTLLMGIMPVVLLLVGIIFATTASASTLSEGGARAAGGIMMIFGIVFGTYSSIFIATPPLLYLHLRRGTAAEEKALAETS